MAGNSPTFGNHWGPGRNPRAVLCCLLDSQEGVSSLSPRSAGEIPSSEAAQRRKELPHLLPAAGWSRRTAAKYVFFLDVWQSTPTLSCLQNSRSLLLPPLKPPPHFCLPAFPTGSLGLLALFSPFAGTDSQSCVFTVSALPSSLRPAWFCGQSSRSGRICECLRALRSFSDSAWA